MWRMFLFVLCVPVSIILAKPLDINEVKEVFVSVENANIFCKIMGSGDPIIVIHGGPGLLHDYLVPEISKLAENNTVIFYDQRGLGRSQGEISYDTMRIDVFLKDIESLRKALDFEKFTILGHSWGCFLALKYALDHPESVDKLILLDPMPLSLDEYILVVMEQTARLSPYQAELRKIVASEKFALKDPAILSRYLILRGGFNFYNPEEAKFLQIPINVETIENSDKISNMFFIEFCRGFNLHEKVGSVRNSSLIIHGDSDFIPSSMAEKIHKEILNSEYHLLENCGHISFIEKSEETMGLINEFLKKK